MDNYQLELFHGYYTDPTSEIFLSKNIERLTSFARKRPNLENLTKTKILQYMQKISDISRDREYRILRGRKRYLSTRKYIFHGPMNILLGDCFFIRNINNPIKGKPLIAVLFMDGFSRFAYINVVPNTKSETMAKELEKSITSHFFKYPFKFCSDRG